MLVDFYYIESVSFSAATSVSISYFEPRNRFEQRVIIGSRGHFPGAVRAGDHPEDAGSNRSRRAEKLERESSKTRPRS